MMLFLDEKYSLYYYVIATVFYAFILCVLNQISVHRHLNYSQEVDKTFLRPILASAIMGAVAFGIYQSLYYLCKVNIISLAAAIGAGGIVYFILVIRWRAVSEEELRGMPKGYMLISIARKIGIMKTETPGKRKKSPKKKASGKRSKKKNKKIQKKQNKAIQEPIDEEDDDYWLDE